MTVYVQHSMFTKQKKKEKKQIFFPLNLYNVHSENQLITLRVLNYVKMYKDN